MSQEYKELNSLPSESSNAFAQMSNPFADTVSPLSDPKAMPAREDKVATPLSSAEEKSPPLTIIAFTQEQLAELFRYMEKFNGDRKQVAEIKADAKEKFKLWVEGVTAGCLQLTFKGQAEELEKTGDCCTMQDSGFQLVCDADNAKLMQQWFLIVLKQTLADPLSFAKAFFFGVATAPYIRGGASNFFSASSPVSTSMSTPSGNSIQAVNKNSAALLLLAVKEGKLNIVQRFLKKDSAMITRRDKKGNTLLLYAAYNGHLAMIQWLLKEGGAVVTESNNDGMTALLLAAGNGCLDVVQWLLEKSDATIAERDNEGRTTLLLAAGNGHLEVVRLLLKGLKKGGAIITERDNENRTALLWAAYNGHLNVVQWLLEKDSATLTEHNNDGMTALLLAAGNGCLDVVQWLLKQDRATVEQKDSDGNTALIAQKDGDGNTALLLAANEGELAMAQWLLEEGGANIGEENNDGDTALLLAANEGDLAMVQWLLQKGDAGVEEQNDDGNTALLLAANDGNLTMVQWLLKEGGADITKENNQGENALYLAAVGGYAEMFIVLISDHGAATPEQLKLFKNITTGDCSALCQNTEFLQALWAGHLQKLLCTASYILQVTLGEPSVGFIMVIIDYMKPNKEELLALYQTTMPIDDTLEGILKAMCDKANCSALPAPLAPQNVRMSRTSTSSSSTSIHIPTSATAPVPVASSRFAAGSRHAAEQSVSEEKSGMGVWI